MSREGWLVAIGACLLLVIVPLAMWSGLSEDTRPRAAGQRPGFLGDDDDVEPFAEESEDVGEETAPADEGAGGAEPMGTRTVFGAVTDAKGTPIERAEVHVEGNAAKTTLTDEDGAFELSDVTVAPIVLVATAFGYGEAQTDVGRGTDDAKSEQDVVLPPSTDVTGMVLDPDGKAVGGASVRCITDTKTKVTVVANAFGQFNFKARTCDAVAHHTGFAKSATVELTVGPNNLLALRPLASIKGLVLDPNDAPYTGFVLSVRSFAPADGVTKMRPYRQTFSHPQGRFQVTQLPAGRFVFIVGLRGRSGIETQPVVVKDGEQLTGVKFIVE